MDKLLVEEIARAMHRQHGKEMLGSIQKWEKASPNERSTWRLIARSTIERIHQDLKGAKDKTVA